MQNLAWVKGQFKSQFWWDLPWRLKSCTWWRWTGCYLGPQGHRKSPAYGDFPFSALSFFCLLILLSVDPEAEWSTAKKDKPRRNERTGLINVTEVEKEGENEDWNIFFTEIGYSAVSRVVFLGGHCIIWSLILKSGLCPKFSSSVWTLIAFSSWL